MSIAATRLGRSVSGVFPMRDARHLSLLLLSAGPLATASIKTSGQPVTSPPSLICPSPSAQLSLFHSPSICSPPHQLRSYSSSTTTTSSGNMASATSFYDFKPLDKRGEEVPLSNYEGKVVLVVNTASKCGFTPQYGGLEKLYTGLKEKHGDDFVILGFPCNQFGKQEPGSNDEIQEFCQLNYGVTFPIMGKVDVNGDGTAPIFHWLKEKKPGIMGIKLIKWNFEKFLVGRDGTVKHRWASTTKPESLEKTIVEELEKK